MDLQTAKTEKTCSQEKIAAYLDGELLSSEELALEAHIANCKSCLTQLNLQKRMLCALDAAFEKRGEINLPKNFAQVVAATAESNVIGLRSKREGFRALFLFALLFLIVLAGLGAETEKTLAAFGKFGEQVAAVAGFALHLIYDLGFGAAVVLRSLSEQIVFSSATSFAAIAGFFMLSIFMLSRLMFRFNRS